MVTLHKNRKTLQQKVWKLYQKGIKEIFWDFEDGIILKFNKTFFRVSEDIYIIFPYI